MKCPVCREEKLVINDRQVDEIDYCPDCGSVWLDHAELDKIIESSQLNSRHAMIELGGKQQTHDPQYYNYKRQTEFIRELFG